MFVGNGDRSFKALTGYRGLIASMPWSRLLQNGVPSSESRFHQLDQNNGPTSTVWQGKPNLCHAVKVMLILDLPLVPTLARALAQRSTLITEGEPT